MSHLLVNNQLPIGRTCYDCIHFRRCSWLISVEANHASCDWIPSRFVDKFDPTPPSDGKEEP